MELARRDLATRLGVEIGRVEIVRLDDAIWPDTCLGVPAPELCAPGATAGYVVVFRLSGKEYWYHTDTVESFRYAGPGDQPEP